MYNPARQHTIVLNQEYIIQQLHRADVYEDFIHNLKIDVLYWKTVATFCMCLNIILILFLI